MTRIKPIIQLATNKESAQALAEEYRWMGRNAEAKGNHVVVGVTEYVPPKRKRHSDDD